MRAQMQAINIHRRPRFDCNNLLMRKDRHVNGFLFFFCFARRLFVRCLLLHDDNDDDDFSSCPTTMSFLAPTIIIYIHFISYHTHHRSSSRGRYQWSGCIIDINNSTSMLIFSSSLSFLSSSLSLSSERERTGGKFSKSDGSSRRRIGRIEMQPEERREAERKINSAFDINCFMILGACVFSSDSLGGERRQRERETDRR